jgi:hypothetical protein
MFVTVDVQVLARNFFRRAQNSINSDGKEWNIKEVIKKFG